MSTNTPSPRLFVGSLPYKFTESDLLSLFITEGKIISIKIIHNRWGRSRGMGYVEYENIGDAVNAKQKYHNYKLEDRTIIVDYAQPDPFKTPEGQARHQEALAKHNKHRKSYIEKNTSHGSRSSTWSDKREDQNAAPPLVRGVKKGQKIRQTVFNSRAFGSKVGAKFASRNKKRK